MVDDIMKTQRTQSEEGRNLSGPKIREIREKSGMTQPDLVEILKEQNVCITACTLSKMENTKRSITDIELAAFARALNVSVETLIS